MSNSPKSTIWVYALSPATKADPFINYFQNKINAPSSPPADQSNPNFVPDDHTRMVQESISPVGAIQQQVRWSLGGYRDTQGLNLNTSTIPHEITHHQAREWGKSLKYEPGAIETLPSPLDPNLFIYQNKHPRLPQDRLWHSFSRNTYSAIIDGCIFLLGSPYLHEILSEIKLKSSSRADQRVVAKFLTTIANAEKGLITKRAVDRLQNDTLGSLGNVSQDENEWAAPDALGPDATLEDLLKTLIGDQYGGRERAVAGIWTGNSGGRYNWIIFRPPYGSRDWAAHNILVLTDALMQSIHDISRSMEDIYGALALADTIPYTNLLSPSNHSQNDEFRFIQEAPFVRNYYTYDYLDRNLSSDDGGAITDPNYLFYQKDYEKGISGSSIPEGVLPNRYIYKICNQAKGLNGGVPDKWDPPPADADLADKADRGREYINDHYKSLLTVQNSFVLDSFDESINSYLTKYTETLPALSSSVPESLPNRQEYIMERQQSLLIPSADLDLLTDKVNFFPMSNTVRFQMESPGPATVAMNTVESSNFPPPHHISSIILDAIRTNFPHMGEVPESTKTTNNPLFIRALKSSMRSPQKASFVGNNLQLSKYDTLPLRRTSITRILDHASREEFTMEPLVLTERGLDVLTGDRPSESQRNGLQDTFRNNLKEIATESFLKYGDYLTSNITGPKTPSEAIAYKIVKKNSDGEVLQEIYIANGNRGSQNNDTNRDRMFEYIDTQVKYNTSYIYEMYEYRIVYTTRCKSIVLPAPSNTEYRLPEWMTKGLGTSVADDDNASSTGIHEIDTGIWASPFNAQAPIAFDSYSVSSPAIHFYEVPIYKSSLYKDKVRQTRRPSVYQPNGRYYTPTKILDYPPPPPDLTIHPLRGNYRQVKVGVDLSTAAFIAEASLRIVDIQPGDHASQWRYQHHLEYFPLRRGFLQFKNESISEIVRVKIIRTTQLNTSVTSYEDLYPSFDESLNSTVVTYDLTKDPEMVDSQLVRSYDLTDNLEPNVRYYYTCVAYDAHGNSSNPSTIKEVQLIYENGSCVPRIEEYSFTPVSRKTPNRKFIRYLQIGPSDIQSNPINKVDDDGEIQGTRNLGTEIGKSIANKDFVVRLTSRDTGRKFDIKLSFTQRDINE